MPYNAMYNALTDMFRIHQQFSGQQCCIIINHDMQFAKRLIFTLESKGIQYFPSTRTWTPDMQWHEGSNFDFCGWMVENLIRR